MKILSIKLINYIGIANGTGLRELYIDFTACKSIIAVVGHNGSGKSTLLKALHPFPDGYDALIPNCEAYKEIKYLKDNHLYEIRIHYTHTDSKNNTEVAIFKDNVNLNPNLNVTNAKDIIMNEFELDSNYIALSQLSSEDRGLADKRPSERKKFVNDILADLSVYNNMYKTLNKKSSTFKNLINNLSYKINNIGGDNLPLLESNVEQLKKQLETLEKQKEDLIVEQTTISNALELNSGLKEECLTIRNQYNNAMQEQMTILNNMNALKSSVTNINLAKILEEIDPKDFTEVGNKVFKEYKLKHTQLTAQFDSNNKLYNEYNNKYQNAISEKNVKLQQIQFLNSNNIDIDSFLKTLKELKTKKRNYQKSIPKDLLNSKNTSETISALYDELSDISYDLNKVIYYLQDSDVEKYGNKLTIESELAQLYNESKENEKLYNELTSNKNVLINIDHIEDIPDNCKNTNCYFCNIKMKYLKMKDMIDKQNKDLEALKTKINDNVLRSSLLKDFLRDYYVVERYAKFLERNKNTISEISKITNIKRHKLYLQDSINLSIAINEALSQYNVLDNYRAIEAEYSKMTAEYVKLSDNISVLQCLENEVKALDNTINECKQKIDTLNISDLNFEIQQLENKLQYTNDMIILGEQYDKNEKDLLVYKAEYDKHEDSIKHMIVLEDKYKDISNSLKTINNDIETTKQAYENTKYNARILKEYKREYDTYINDYQKIETIKRFTSPTTGIQTLFMETYMNNVLIIANQLLSLMFNGEFILRPFIINETEFKIPCAGSGYLNDDISSMSTSQICIISMIISFAMLYNSSSCYNIIKLDEIDSGLDNDNRFKFVEMLDQIMNIMHCEQCFIISHNMELDESQITKIDMNSF